MQRPDTFAVNAAPLAQAIELFRETTGANVYVDWRSIAAIGIDRDTPVTWPGERAGIKANTMGDALNRVLEAAAMGKGNLRCFFAGDAVVVSTEPNLAALVANDAGADEVDGICPPITVAFDGTPLHEAITEIRKTKVNVFMNWRALEVVGVDQRTPVTLKLRDAKLSSVLGLLLYDAAAGRARLAFGLEDGVVTISTGEDLSRNTLTRVYDARDVLKGRQPEELIDAITATIAPTSWRDRGGSIGSVRELSGQLIVTQTPDVHAAIGRWIDEQRPAGAEKPRAFPILSTKATTRPAQ